MTGRDRMVLIAVVVLVALVLAGTSLTAAISMLGLGRDWPSRRYCDLGDPGCKSSSAMQDDATFEKDAPVAPCRCGVSAR